MIRLILVLGCLVLLVALLAAMRIGWRNRLRAQAALDARPAVPADPGPVRLGPLAGVYAGTTFARRWQDRIVAGGLGLRSPVEVSLHDDGVLLRRTGAAAVWIPSADLLGARLEAALAGKVVGPGGLLVLTWRLAGTEVDSGVRADDKSDYPRWVEALTRAAAGTGPEGAQW